MPVDTLELFEHSTDPENKFPPPFDDFHLHAVKGGGEPSLLFHTTGSIVLNDLTLHVARRFGPGDDFEGNALAVHY